jgi:hypothetical protein
VVNGTSLENSDPKGSQGFESLHLRITMLYSFYEMAEDSRYYPHRYIFDYFCGRKNK